MTRAPQIGFLADGKRLHLQDGPIDLIVEAHGARENVRVAYANAAARFDGLLDELCSELPALRQQAEPAGTALQGVIAQRMYRAVEPFSGETFITPMAAVAGSVAEEILAAMLLAAPLDRAYVNNGGDIALHLARGQSFTIGLIDRPDRPSMIGKTMIRSSDESRGIATSGRHGRSFSLGIADAVTALAKTAAQADAAATVIANAVDLPGHPAIVRVPASDLQPDNDLGERLVTRNVGALSHADVIMALQSGVDRARDLLARGLIAGASLSLHGETEIVGPLRIPAAVSQFAPAA